MSSNSNFAATVPQRAWMSARVFRLKGRPYIDPAGVERIAGGGTWVDEKEGEWVEHGVISDSASPAGGRSVVTRPPGLLARIWTIIRNLWRKPC